MAVGNPHVVMAIMATWRTSSGVAPAASALRALDLTAPSDGPPTAKAEVDQPRRPLVQRAGPVHRLAEAVERPGHAGVRLAELHVHAGQMSVAHDVPPYCRRPRGGGPSLPAPRPQAGESSGALEHEHARCRDVAGGPLRGLVELQGEGEVPGAVRRVPLEQDEHALGSSVDPKDAPAERAEAPAAIGVVLVHRLNVS